MVAVAEEQKDKPNPEAAQKAEEPHRAEERALNLEKAEKRLEELFNRFQVTEEAIFLKQGSRLEAMVLDEEFLHQLGRDQAVERDREKAEVKAVEALLLQQKYSKLKSPVPNTVEEKEFRGRLHDLEVRLSELDQSSKENEARRTKQYVEARKKVIYAERLYQFLGQELGLRREQLQQEIRDAHDRVRELRGDGPTGTPQPQELREIGRKLDQLLREVGDLRRAVERRQPAKD